MNNKYKSFKSLWGCSVVGLGLDTTAVTRNLLQGMFSPLPSLHSFFFLLIDFLFFFSFFPQSQLRFPGSALSSSLRFGCKRIFSYTIVLYLLNRIWKSKQIWLFFEYIRLNSSLSFGAFKILSYGPLTPKTSPSSRLFLISGENKS